MSGRRWAACALILLLVAGNAALVQAVAWTSMIVDRAQSMDLRAAVSTVLTRDAPCAMCCAAAALRDDAPSDGGASRTPVKKIDGRASVLVMELPAVCGGRLPPFPSCRRLLGRSDKPDLPPPRT